MELLTPAESDICCGSAGIYNLVQPDPAAQLGERKARHIAALSPDLIATANPGCMLQIAAAGRRLRVSTGRSFTPSSWSNARFEVLVARRLKPALYLATIKAALPSSARQAARPTVISPALACDHVLEIALDARQRLFDLRARVGVQLP